MRELERRTDRWRIVVAALFVAAAQLVAAWLATLESPWWLMAVPVLMALTVAGAGFYLQPLGGRRVVQAGLIMAVAVLAASALAAHDSPQDLRELLPVIGGSTGGMLVILAGAARRRRVC